MLVYRITLEQFSHSLKASGRAARWNSNDVHMIYTSSSRSLACLENVVHRNQLGLNNNFRLLTIEISDKVKPEILSVDDLQPNWKEYSNLPYTQKIGSLWIKKAVSAVLKIPSSIVQDEFNYLINPEMINSKNIKILKTELFVFDDRIKRQ